MKSVVSRRTILRGGLALAGLGVAGIPEWALPLLAQGETLVPFTDIPENVRWETPPDRRTFDLRSIDGPFTPADKFFTTQHYGHPTVDPTTFKLKLSGLVNTPKALSLDELKRLGSTDLAGRVRVFRKSRAAQRPERQRQVDRRAVEDRAQHGGRESRRPRHRVLRCRSWRRRSRMAHEEIQDRLSLRPQPAA